MKTPSERLRAIVREKERALVMALVDAVESGKISEPARALARDLRAYYENQTKETARR